MAFRNNFIKKRTIAILFVCLFLITGGLGCKGLSSAEKQAVSTVNLEYWTVADDVDEIEKMIAKYKVGRPYINVTLRQLREDELYNRYIEALADDIGPDIISVHTRMLPAYKTKLDTMPTAVNDATVQVVKKKLGTQTAVTQSTIFLPNSRSINNEFVQTVGKDVIDGDSIYGLPLSLDTMALYYNKDLLDRAGVAQAPKDWSDFQLAVKKLTKTDKDGKLIQSAAALGTSNNVEGFEDILYLLFEQSGIKFVDKNGNAIFSPSSINSANNPVVKVMNFYADYANPKRDTYTWDKNFSNSLDEFARGKTAFFFGYSYHYKKILSKAPQLNVEVIPMLQLNSSNPVNVANYWIQTVSKKSTNKNEAWALVNYLTHSSETKNYLTNTKRPSALRAYITEQKSDVILKPFVEQILVANNWYRGKSYSTAKKALGDMVDQWHKAETSTDRNDLYAQILSRATSRINQSL